MASDIHLYQFQKEVIQKFLKSGSLIAALPTGTGKTVVALSIITKLSKKYKDFKCLVVVPANLRSNFRDNILKFHLNVSNSIITSLDQFERLYQESSVLVVSYNFVRSYYQQLLNYRFHLIICDEIHYAKNKGSVTFRSLFILRQNTIHFLGLTASPISNNAQEFFTIIALVADDKTIITRGMKTVKIIRLGAEKKSKISRVLFGPPKRGTKVEVGIKDPEAFKRLVGKWIYIPKMEKITSTGKRPDVRSFIIKVPLSSYEVKIYKYIMGKIPSSVLKQLESGTISDNDVRKIKNWLIAAQQALISPDYIIQSDMQEVTNPQAGSKVRKVGEILKETKEKSIVYTPFLRFGAKVANHYFNSIGIKSVEYSGAITHDERRKIVNLFEKGDLQVICLTGAGQEGINLPSCKNVFFLSLHFNPEVMRQVMGRALRVTSKNPYVKVYFVFAVIQTAFGGQQETVDHWISRIVNRKTLLRQAIYNILQEVDLEE